MEEHRDANWSEVARCAFEETIRRQDMRRAAEIAYDGDVTIYDALPVALAEMRGTVCVTGDVKTQFSRLSSKGYPVEPLSSLG